MSGLHNSIIWFNSGFLFLNWKLIVSTRGGLLFLLDVFGTSLGCFCIGDDENYGLPV